MHGRSANERSYGRVIIRQRQGVGLVAAGLLSLVISGCGGDSMSVGDWVAGPMHADLQSLQSSTERLDSTSRTSMDQTTCAGLRDAVTTARGHKQADDAELARRWIALLDGYSEVVGACVGNDVARTGELLTGLDGRITALEERIRQL
jgi:hypothetical protein